MKWRPIVRRAELSLAHCSYGHDFGGREFGALQQNCEGPGWHQQLRLVPVLLLMCQSAMTSTDLLIHG